MTPMKRIVFIALLLPLGACTVYSGPPPDWQDWQQPRPASQQPSVPQSDFGSDLRLSEFQGAKRQQDKAWPPADPEFQVVAESWQGSGIDSGIQPRVYRAPTPLAQAASGDRSWSPPRASSPIAAGAGLGPGDGVLVSVFGQPDLETSTVVAEAGLITLPLVGAINVAGLEPQQAEQRIAQAYLDGGYLVNPQITLTVQELRSRQISVLGQVQQPGRFPLSSRMTLLDALALAGGVSRTGGSTVYLIRQVNGQARKFEINIDRMLAAPDTRTLLELGAGDTVYVPEAPLFYIYGEVRRPDGYALKPGMTVMQAISVGGGLTDRGSDSRLRIRRRDGNGGTRSLRPSLEDPVREGDVIYVKERLF